MFNIDFRNAFYHGQIREAKPHGIGLIIDSQLLFALAEFQCGQVEGPVFAVYPDSKVFCGRIKDRQPSGLCCFYLKDKMQVYMNYGREGRERNLVAVLPFCKVILEVEILQGQPKVRRYENYGGRGGELRQFLEGLLGTASGLDEFGSWQDFLLINFIGRYQKQLLWKIACQEKYNQFFLGAKYSGLGIKMLVFSDEELANNVQGSPLLVSELGSFAEGEVLKGYGVRLLDYQHFAKFEEGVFQQSEKETFEYFHSSRPAQVRAYLDKNLLKSVTFENVFFHLGYLYKLETLYAKLNVSLVEETHKIALVTMNGPNDSPVELAEIEKRHRRRNQTPPSSKFSPIKSHSTFAANQRDFEGKMASYEESQGLLQNQPASVSEAKRSIYGSVEKVKRVNPQVRSKAIRNFQKMVQGKIGDFSDSLQRPSLKQTQQARRPKHSFNQLQNTTPQKYFQIYPSSYAQEVPRGERTAKNRYNYGSNNEFDDFIRGDSRQKSFTPTKHEKAYENIPNLQSYYQRAPDPRFQSFKPLTRNNADIALARNSPLPRNNSPLTLDKYNLGTPIKKASLRERLNEAYNSHVLVEQQRLPRNDIDLPLQAKSSNEEEREGAEKKKFAGVEKAAYSRQKEATYQKTVLEEDVYQRYQGRIDQKQKQLAYFNGLFGQLSRKAGPEIKNQQQTAPSPFKNKTPPLKNKTPGKIKVFNLKKDNQLRH